VSPRAVAFSPGGDRGRRLPELPAEPAHFFCERPAAPAACRATYKEKAPHRRGAHAKGGNKNLKGSVRGSDAGVKRGSAL
jgi:hypothetical protein